MSALHLRGTDVVLKFWLLAQTTFVTDKMLDRMQAAYSIGAAKCSVDWGTPIPTIQIAGKVSDIPDDGIPVVYSPTIDAPGDLAYHTLLDGRPYSLVLADPNQVNQGDVELSGDHEVKETIGDPDCSGWVKFAAGVGSGFKSIAQEICDPTENDVVLVDLGDGDPVRTSNWVTPSWFDAASTIGARLDELGKCKRPLEVLPGGYAVIVDPDGSTRQIGAGPAAFKRNPAFRHGRRLAAAHQLGMRIKIAKAR